MIREICNESMHILEYGVRSMECGTTGNRMDGRNVLDLRSRIVVNNGAKGRMLVKRLLV